MKKNTLFIITLLCSLQSFGQWVTLNSGTNNSLEEVYFLNQDTGFVVGVTEFLKTTDGGNSWQTAYAGSYALMGVYFPDNTNGYAVGLDLTSGQSLVIKTLDGGSNWTPSLIASQTFSDVFFLNANTGYIVGGGGVAYRTTNGGVTWDSLSTGTNDLLTGVFFTDSQNGIIVGGPVVAPLILKTTDGGNSWNTINSPATDFLQSVFFPSSLIGYIVGWNGDILKTIDGGTTWTIQTPAIVYGNIDVFFTDNLTGYIVGGSTNFTGIQKTIDGGQTWFTQTSNSNSGLLGVNFPIPSIGYAVGENGTIIKTTNGGGVGISDFNQPKLTITAYPNPFVNELIVSIDESIDQMNITIFDLTGKTIHQTISSNSNEKINLASLNNGTYFLVVETKKGKVVQKIVKS